MLALDPLTVAGARPDPVDGGRDLLDAGPDGLGALTRSGRLDLALPGSGSTWSRFQALSAWARRDVSAARLVEAHADAVAILAELGAPPPSGLTGVWAAEDRIERLEATIGPRHWELNGVKRWCSGAGLVDAALVTAWAPDGRRLFLVERAAGLEPLEGSWPVAAMARADTRDVAFRGVRLPLGSAIGGPDAYLARPGFWHGAVGVAACWHGGALGLADALLERVRERPDPHRLAHLGAVEAALTASAATLRVAADEIDADPGDAGAAELRAFAARAVVEATATEVLLRVGRATGAEPLAHDAAHARRAAELTLYLRQSHAEADLAHLGTLLARS